MWLSTLSQFSIRDPEHGSTEIEQYSIRCPDKERRDENRPAGTHDLQQIRCRPGGENLNDDVQRDLEDGERNEVGQRLSSVFLWGDAIPAPNTVD